jgi:hypothetical protein
MTNRTPDFDAAPQSGPANYRLYESAGFAATCPPFADSDDFHTLRLWAIEHNDWKGVRMGAVIVSDSGRIWYVRRDGTAREACNARPRNGGLSQVEKFLGRLDGSRHFTEANAAQLGYELPSPARYRHETIHVVPEKATGRARRVS